LQHALFQSPTPEAWFIMSSEPLLQEMAAQLTRELGGWYLFAAGWVLAGPQGREITGTCSLCFGSQGSFRNLPDNYS
jgi:hypothetical protein